MPKIQIGANTHRALKVMAALSQSQTMEEIAQDILTAGIPNSIWDMISRWEEHELDSVDLPKNYILDNNAICDHAEKEKCTNTFGAEPSTDKATSLKLLLKLKEILEQNGEAMVRDIRTFFPEIPKSGPIFRSFGIEYNENTKKYNADQIPLIDAAIKKLEDGE